MPERNNPDFFPRLRLDTLQKHANRWAAFLFDKFDALPLESITLYSALPDKPYMVLFTFRVPADLKNPLFSQLNDYLTDPRIRTAMICDLEEVYKESPNPDFLDREWQFRFMEPINLDQTYSWVLYSSLKIEQGRKFVPVAWGNLKDHMSESAIRELKAHGAEHPYQPDLETSMPYAAAPEHVPDQQEQEPAKKKREEDYTLEHAKISAKQLNERFKDKGKRPLTRPQLAKVLHDDAKRKKLPLAGYPIWKIEKALKGVCPRGKPLKTK